MTDLEILKAALAKGPTPVCPHNNWLWRKSHPNYCADCGLYAVAMIAKLQAQLAACSPDRISRLIERIENAEARGIHTCHAHCSRAECVLRRQVKEYEGALEKCVAYDKEKQLAEKQSRCAYLDFPDEAEAVLAKWRTK